MNMFVIDLSYWWFIHLSNLSCECRAWKYLLIILVSFGQDSNKPVHYHHGSWFIIISSQEVPKHILRIICKKASVISWWQLVCTGWAAPVPPDNTSCACLPVHYLSVLCSNLGGIRCLHWIGRGREDWVPGKISAATWKVEIPLTLETRWWKTKLLSFICTLVTGLILHTMNLYIFGGGWFVFTLMLLDHKFTVLVEANLIVTVLSLWKLVYWGRPISFFYYHGVLKTSWRL